MRTRAHEVTTVSQSISRSLPVAHLPLVPRIAASLKQRASTILAVMFILAVLLGLLAWDFWTPLGWADWVFYLPIILVSLWLPFQWDSVVLAAVSSVLILIGYWYSPRSHLDPTLALFNRFIGITVIWVIATGCFFQKQSWRVLKQHEAQLRALAARLEKIREEESTRIARDIHDELGQLLTALKVNLSWIEQQLRQLPAGAARDQVDKKLAAAIGLTSSAISSVQRIASDLRPIMLGDQGIIAALEWLAHEFQQRTGIECTFDSDALHVNLSDDRAIVVFRVVQESLTNIARHANATRASITLQQVNGAIAARVRDNGRGITEYEKGDVASLGLIGMRERASSFGGEVVLAGEPGKGTIVELLLPVQ
jgi:signal transduction histidine kinase